MRRHDEGKNYPDSLSKRFRFPNHYDCHEEGTEARQKFSQESMAKMAFLTNGENGLFNYLEMTPI